MYIRRSLLDTLNRILRTMLPAVEVDIPKRFCSETSQQNRAQKLTACVEGDRNKVKMVWPWNRSTWCENQNRLDGKTVVLTGCNSGLGKETAREFYKRGGKIVMACRDTVKAEQAADDIKQSTEGLSNVGQLTIRELDLGSLESVRKCAHEIQETESAIHLLVNNAGIAACPKYLSQDGYELQFATNHLGHFLFTLLLLPRIIESTPARIVIVSSKSYQFGDGKMHFEDVNFDKNDYEPHRAYARSKLANILFAAELGKRLQGTGVTTYALHPGVIETELMERHIRESYPRYYWVGMLLRWPFLRTVAEGIQTTLYCSLDDKCANETGKFYSDCAVATPYYRARNMDAAKELWDESLKLVKLSHDYIPFELSKAVH